MSFTSPTSDKKPENPCLLTSGIPPELLDTTGTPIDIASNAARPKLSVCEGNKKASEIASTSEVSLIFPRKRICAHKESSLHNCSQLYLSGPSPTNKSFAGTVLIVSAKTRITSSTLFTFLKFEI